MFNIKVNTNGFEAFKNILNLTNTKKPFFTHHFGKAIEVCEYTLSKCRETGTLTAAGRNVN